MLRRHFLFLSLITIFILSPITEAVGTFTLKEVRSITIHAPAVTLSGKVMKGVLTNITITLVRPGRGRVFISTTPLSQLDIQASARVAAMIACELAGVPSTCVDFLIEVKSNSIVIGGPSASAYMCVAMYALIKGLKLRDDVSMTGMINPDGSIGPVGGILEKAEAVAKRGVKLFLIPLGEEETTTYEVREREIGPFIYRELIPRRINVVAYAREKFGLKVIPVYNIGQAISYFTGLKYKVLKPPISITLSPRYLEALKNMGEELLRIDTKLYNELNSKLSGAFAEELKRYYQLMEESKRLLNEGRYYVASSRAFALLTHLKYLELVYEVNEKGERAFVRRAKEANATLTSLYEKVKSFKPTLTNIGLLIAIVERLEETRKSLTDSGKYYKQYLSEGFDSLLVKAVDSLSFSEARLAGVELWLKWIRKLKVWGTKVIPLPIIKRVTENLMDEAYSVMAYALSIFGEERIEEVKKVEEYLNMAKEAYLKGDYLSASADSIRVLAYLLYEFNTIVRKEALGKIVNYSRSQALTLCNEAKELGMEPYLALNYLEYGDYVRDLLDRIFFYKLAAIHAKYLIIIAKEIKNLSKSIGIIIRP